MPAIERFSWQIAIVLLVPMSVTGVAQRPGFDVASVKPNTRGELMIRLDTEPGGRFIATNVPLRGLIVLAYGVRDFEIVGAPDWAAADRFDVEAKSGVDLPPLDGPGQGSPVLQQMLQELLRDRFGFVAHTDTIEAQMFALELIRADGRLGPRLTPTATDCAALVRQRGRDDGPPPCGFRMAPGSIVLEGVPMSQLASGVAGLVGRQVVDRTGLSGNFDLQLSWDPPQPLSAGSPVSGVSLFTALADQAGLRLVQTRGPAKVLVVDAVRKPSPN